MLFAVDSRPVNSGVKCRAPRRMLHAGLRGVRRAARAVESSGTRVREPGESRPAGSGRARVVLAAGRVRLASAPPFNNSLNRSANRRGSHPGT
jgi:hypothetical protein